MAAHQNTTPLEVGPVSIQLVAIISVEDSGTFRKGTEKAATEVNNILLQSCQNSGPVPILLATDGDQAASVLAVERLKQQNPTARIVVLSDRCEPGYAMAVLRAGADGLLLKKLSCDALIKSLDLVMHGVTIVPSELSRLLGEANDTDCDEQWDSDEQLGHVASSTVPKLDQTPRRLSDRETGILRCLMRGDSNKHIARQFSITDATVKVHIKAIMRKICVQNRTQAAVWAHHHHLDPAAITNGAKAQLRCADQVA